MTYELWESPHETRLLPVDDLYDRRLRQLDDDFHLMTVFLADSMEDACEQRNEFMGWNCKPVYEEVF